MIDIDLVERHNLDLDELEERVEAFNSLCNQLYDDYCNGDISLYMLRLETAHNMSWFQIRLMLQKVLEIPFDDEAMTERQKNVCQKIGFAITQILPYSKLIERSERKLEENLN